MDVCNARIREMEKDGGGRGEGGGRGITRALARGRISQRSSLGEEEDGGRVVASGRKGRTQSSSHVGLSLGGPPQLQPAEGQHLDTQRSSCGLYCRTTAGALRPRHQDGHAHARVCCPLHTTSRQPAVPLSSALPAALAGSQVHAVVRV